MGKANKWISILIGLLWLGTFVKFLLGGKVDSFTVGFALLCTSYFFFNLATKED